MDKIPEGWKIERLALDMVQVMTPDGARISRPVGNSDDPIEVMFFEMCNDMLTAAPSQPAAPRVPEWRSAKDGQHFPKIGAHYLVRYKGSFLSEVFQFDQTDDGMGGGEYFWSNDLMEICPTFSWEHDEWLAISTLTAAPAPADPFTHSAELHASRRNGLPTPVHDDDGRVLQVNSAMPLFTTMEGAELAALRERVKVLEDVIENVAQSLEYENARGAINDTLWVLPHISTSMTLFDYIDEARLRGGSDTTGADQ